MVLDANLARARQARRLNPALAIPAVVSPDSYAPETVPLPQGAGPYVEPDRAAAGYYGQGRPSPDGESTRRRRVERPLEFTEDRINTLEGMSLEPVSTRQKIARIASEAGEALLERPARGGADVVTNTLRGVGRAAPAMFGDMMAREQRAEEIAGLQRQWLGADAVRRRIEERKQRAAQLGLTQANAEYARQRPDLEAAKRADAQAKSERASVLSLLRMHKGVKLDPNNSAHSRLLERAAAAGIEIDPESWNNAKDNLVQMTLTDQSDPSKTEVVMFNRVTGERQSVGQKGFQPVRNAEGRTASEVAADDDRDRAFNANEAYRRQVLSLSGERLKAQLSSGLGAAAAREFHIKTAGVQQRLGQIRTQIEGWQVQARQSNVAPASAERRIAELNTEADKLIGQLEGARQEALGKMGSASSPAAGSPSTPAGRVSRRNFDTVRRQNPSLAGKSDAEVEAALKAAGVEVY